jgi:hypothetical protein
MNCDPQAFVSRHPPEEHPTPNARAANAVRLEFTPDSLVQANLDPVRFEGEHEVFGDLPGHD